MKAFIIKEKNGNRGANVKSICPEVAKSLRKEEKGVFAEIGIFSQMSGWGAVKQAAHSHFTVEELLFPGD